MASDVCSRPASTPSVASVVWAPLSTRILRCSNGVTSSTKPRAHQIPARHPAGEFPFDHPLPERLADGNGGIAVAEPLLDAVEVILRHRRRDAVDHGRREGGIAAIQSAKPLPRRSAKVRTTVFEDHAVGRNVVAGEQRQRLAMRCPAPLQRPRQKAGHAARCLRVGEIVDDVGMAKVELPARRDMAIALFGHRHRHQIDVR